MNNNSQKDIQNDKNKYNKQYYPIAYFNVNKNNLTKSKKQKDIIKSNLEYAIKKTEKLATAIYLVTSIISDLEPIKWTLRDKSIQLLSNISDAKNNQKNEITTVVLNLTNLISDIKALLNLSYSVGIISEMNFSVLVDEYKILNDFIFENNLREEQDILTQDVLRDLKEPHGVSASVNHKGHNTYKNVFYGNKKNQVNDISLSNKNMEASLLSVKKIQLKNKKNSKINNNRKQIIKDIIKQKKEVTIKDLSSIINGCSEKTIQRELLSLINENIVKKTGEKRWSRYSLA